MLKWGMFPAKDQPERDRRPISVRPGKPSLLDPSPPFRGAAAFHRAIGAFVRFCEQVGASRASSRRLGLRLRGHPHPSRNQFECRKHAGQEDRILFEEFRRTGLLIDDAEGVTHGGAGGAERADRRRKLHARRHHIDNRQYAPAAILNVGQKMKLPLIIAHGEEAFYFVSALVLLLVIGLAFAASGRILCMRRTEESQKTGKRLLSVGGICLVVAATLLAFMWI